MNIAYRGFKDKNCIVVASDNGDITEREYNDNVPAILRLENDIELLEKEKSDQIEIKEEYAQNLKSYKNGKFSKIKCFLKEFVLTEIPVIIGVLVLPTILNWLSAESINASIETIHIMQMVVGVCCSFVSLLESLRYTNMNYNYYNNQKLQYDTTQEIINEIEAKIKQKQEKIKQLEETKTYTENIPLRSTKVSYDNKDLKELSALKETLLNYNKYLKYYEKGKLEAKLQKMYTEPDANLIVDSFQRVYQLKKDGSQTH